MKRDFSAPLLDLDGKPIRLGISMQAMSQALDAVWQDIPSEVRDRFTKALDEAAGEPATLGSVSTQALLAVFKDEENLPGDERMARMTLARRVHRKKVIDIMPADRDRLNPLLRKAFPGPMISTLASELLEAEVPKEGTTADVCAEPSQG